MYDKTSTLVNDVLCISTNNYAGQSGSEDMSVDVVGVVLAVSLFGMYVCFWPCICCLTGVVYCTCLKKRKSKKASAEPTAAAEMVAEESNQNLPLPPIPNELYEEIVVTESNVETDESNASCSQSALPTTTTIRGLHAPE